MREAFIMKKFNREHRELISVVSGILDKYSAAGYDLTLRQLYYQLVSKNVVENTEQSYKRIGGIVSDARLAGLLDWSMIRDRERVSRSNPHWDSPAEVLRSAASSWNQDLWRDQPYHVEVMVEKRALEGILIPLCSKLDVTFTANKGYSSTSALYETGKRMEEFKNDGKKICVIYLGDHDPSGMDMSRDVLDRLIMFSHGPIEVDRVALNMPQIEELNPPENPAKLTDSRADKYIEKYGRSSWELDAIEPNMLVDIVTKAIHKRMDMDLFDAAVEERERQRGRIVEVADRFDYENDDG